MNYEEKLVILVNMLEGDLCVFCFLATEQGLDIFEKKLKLC